MPDRFINRPQTVPRPEPPRRGAGIDREQQRVPDVEPLEAPERTAPGFDRTAEIGEMPEHMTPALEPGYEAPRKPPQPTNKELRAAESERFFSGEFTPMESVTVENHSEPEKWKRERALNYFLGEKFNEPAMKIAKMPDIYRKSYFGDVSVDEAYKRALRLRQQKDDPLTGMNVDTEPDESSKRGGMLEKVIRSAEWMNQELIEDYAPAVGRRSFTKLVHAGATGFEAVAQNIIIPAGNTFYQLLIDPIYEPIMGERFVETLDRGLSDPDLMSEEAIRMNENILSAFGLLPDIEEEEKYGLQRAAENVWLSLVSGMYTSASAIEVFAGEPRVAEKISAIGRRFDQRLEERTPEDVIKRANLAKERSFELAKEGDWWGAVKTALSSSAWLERHVPSTAATAIQSLGFYYMSGPVLGKLQELGTFARNPKTQNLIRQYIQTLPGSLNISLQTSGLDRMHEIRESHEEETENVLEMLEFQNQFLERIPSDDTMFWDSFDNLLQRAAQLKEEKEWLFDDDRMKSIYAQGVVWSTLRHSATSAVAIHGAGIMKREGMRIFGEGILGRATGILGGFGLGVPPTVDDEMLEHYMPEINLAAAQNGVTDLLEAGMMTPRLFDALLDKDRFSAALSVSLSSGRSMLKQTISEGYDLTKTRAEKDAFWGDFNKTIQRAATKETAPPGIKQLAEEIKNDTKPQKIAKKVIKHARTQVDDKLNRTEEAMERDVAVIETIEETDQYRQAIEEARNDLREELAAVQTEAPTEDVAEQVAQEADPGVAPREAQRESAVSRLLMEIDQREEQPQHRKHYEKALKAVREYDGEKNLGNMTDAELAQTLGFKNVNKTVRTVREALQDAEETVTTPFDEPVLVEEPAPAEVPEEAPAPEAPAVEEKHPGERDRLIAKAIHDDIAANLSEFKMLLDGQSPYDVDIQSLRELVLGRNEATRIAQDEEQRSRLADEKAQERRRPTEPELTGRVTRLNQMVERFKERFKGLAETKVVRRAGHLPAELRERINQKVGDPTAANRVEAVVDRGTVYLVAENIHSDAEGLAFWLSHEQAIHRGLRQLIGEDALNELLDDVYNQFADEIEQSLPADYQNLESREKTEEYLARLAEKVLQHDEITSREMGAWQRIVQWFRQAAKRIFGIDIHDPLAERISQQEHLGSRESQRLAEIIRDGIRGLEVEPGVAPEETRIRTASEKTPLHRNSPEHSIAVSLARRIIDGKSATEADASKLMRDTGLGDDPGEMVAKANRIAEETSRKIRDVTNDAVINQALKSEELRQHYESRVAEVYGKGRDDGTVQQQAEQKIENMRERRKQKEIKARRGMSPQELSNVGLDTLQMATDLVAPDTPVSAEAITGFINQIKDAVRTKLINEGRLDEGVTAFDREPVFRAEYQKTMRRVLDKAALKLVPSHRRESIRLANKEMQYRTTAPAVDRAVADTIGKIQSEQTRQTAKQIRSNIDKTLRTVAKGKVAARTELHKRRMYPDVEQWLRLVKHAVRMSEANANERMQEIEEQLNNDAPAHAENRQAWRDNLLDEMKVLNTFSALHQKTNTQLEYANHVLQQEIKEGRERIKALRERRDEEMNKKANTIIDAVKPKKAQRPSPTERGTADSLNAYLTGTLQLSHRLEDLIRKAGNKEHANAKTLFDDLSFRIHVARVNRDTERREAQERLKDALERIYGIKGLNALHKLNEANEQYVRFSRHNKALTKSNLIQIYSMWEQQEDYRENMEQYGRGEEYINDLKTELTPEDFALLDWMRDWYDDATESISEVSEKTTGLRIEKPNEVYTPGVMEIPDVKISEPHIGAQTVPKALTPRERHKRDIDEAAGILDVWYDRLEDMTQFKHYGELAQEVRGVYSRTDLMQAIEQFDSKDAAKQLREHFANILRGREAMKDSDLRFFESARRVFVLSKMAYNFGVALRQMESVMAYGIDEGLLNTGKHLATAFTAEGVEAMKIILQSDQALNRRYFGNTEAIMHAMAGRSPGQIHQFFKTGMMLQKYGDIFAALPVGQGIYRSHLEEGAKTGMQGEELNQYALNKLFQKLEATQQSAAMENRALWQMHGRTFGRWFGTFMSVQRQRASHELRAVRDVINKAPGGNVRLMRALALYHFILPTFFNGIRIGLQAIMGDEPEWEDEAPRLAAAMVAGPASGLVIGGYFLTYLAQTITDDPTRHYHDDMIPVSGAVRDIDNFTKILKGLGTDDVDSVEAMNRLLQNNFYPYRAANKFYEHYIEE